MSTMLLLPPAEVAAIDGARAWTTPTSRARATWDDVVPYLPRLEPIEADILEMRHWGMTQESIGAFFGMLQAAVSYRISRARAKLQMLRCLPPQSELRRLGRRAERLGVNGADCLSRFLECWSATRAGEATGRSQHAARAAVVSCLEEMTGDGRTGATARRVLEAVRARWSSKLSGARTFVEKTEPLVQVSADRELPPAVMRRVVEMVERWEQENRRG